MQLETITEVYFEMKFHFLFSQVKIKKPGNELDSCDRLREKLR